MYEMNRSGSTGYSGLDAAYHNYGLQGDMESWKSDKYSSSQGGRYKRGSSSSSGGGTERHGRGQDRGEGPYQSGLYDRFCNFQASWLVSCYLLIFPQLEDGVEPHIPRLPDHALPPPHIILHDKRRQEVRFGFNIDSFELCVSTTIS